MNEADKNRIAWDYTPTGRCMKELCDAFDKPIRRIRSKLIMPNDVIDISGKSDQCSIDYKEEGL